MSVQEGEQWAETAARQFDKIAEELERFANEWWARPPHQDNAHMVTVCLLKAATWREAARSLRQPKALSLEREEYELATQQKDRSNGTR